MLITLFNAIPFSFKKASNCSAWATFLGNPSNMNPFWQSSWEILSVTNPTVNSSGTSNPWSINSLAFFPRSVPSLMFFLNISPVDIWGIWYFSTIPAAWVPLPAPGGPNNISLIVSSPIYFKNPW